MACGSSSEVIRSAKVSYPQALELTGISGVFSDANLGITNATVGSLVPINHATPEPTNLLAPADFSRFAVASGLAPESHGFLTYDNLYYPGGSPQTASSYPPHGGALDIYGMMFNIGGGRVVDVWSNGDLSGTGTADYGVAVATSSSALDYVGGNVSLSASPSPTPEPGTVVTLFAGLALLGWRLRNRVPRASQVTRA